MTTLHVCKLARGYRYVPGGRVHGFGHVVGPVFGQVYSAEQTVSGYVIELTSIGAGHFREKHPDAVEC